MIIMHRTRKRRRKKDTKDMEMKAGESEREKGCDSVKRMKQAVGQESGPEKVHLCLRRKKRLFDEQGPGPK